jgi:NADH:ubiquinone oxidoreductase subunit F (NADH-binding)/(2Fe-2S) ferredoxin
MIRINSPADLGKLRQDILSKKDPARQNISICAGTGCLALGVQNVIAAFKEELKKHNLESKVDIRETGCPGFCEQGPLIVITPGEICYVHVRAEDVKDIVSQTLIDKRVVDRLLYVDPVSKQKIVKESEIPFYKYQTRTILGNNGLLDPKKIDDYIALGGYSALAKAFFEMTPEKVMEEVKKANIRGRGGGGFPTSRKWETTRDAPEKIKYVIVNCDEGDPGAFMNRALMEGNPHSVLEGLVIGAYTIGAHEGFIYVREEYPLAIDNTLNAIKQAEEYGLLGENIMGSEFNFTVKVHRGAGSYVSGESSALMTAIEGAVGEPRPKYIHTAVEGLWNKPSCLNNVETWANIPLLLNKGVDWYNSIGNETSKGTKIYSLVGKVNNTGLVEVPLGTSLRQIIFKIGGGIPKEKKFKAIQTGGPSGGCIPEKFLDSPVDFDTLTKLGSMMGSGGLIVMDEDTCMVDVARYFVDFLSDESCGKCSPCREGLRQMRDILNDITSGKGDVGDIELLEALGTVMVDASLCALGQTAANPVLSTLRFFRDEYESHIKEKRCPAGVCKNLTSYYIDPAKCQACMICLRNCPVKAISGEKNLIHIIDQGKCSKCGTCYDVCPTRFNAVKKISGKAVPAATSVKERTIAGRNK